VKIITEKEAPAFLKKMKMRSSVSIREDDVQKAVRKILLDVQKNGDRAIIKYTERFDGFRPKRLAVSKREIESAAGKIDSKFMKALRLSARRIRTFHDRQKSGSWKFTEDGITLGQIVRPLERVGVYVPGGKAAYPSTVLMNVIPAQVAGVSEIALCVPSRDGRMNPYVAAAIKLLGVEEVYRIGGAQAVGALAFGTGTIKKVDKIVGPGNIYVAVAKRLVFGEVGIDMVAGPSEVLIIADDTAEPSFIAADLLSQAEHDEMASSVLVTDSKRLAEDVREEISAQMKQLVRRQIAMKSIGKYGAIIVTRDLEHAAGIANSISPEHLEIMTGRPSRLLPMIKNAGAIFLGRWSPEPLGDYSAGPNHTLPTGGTARFASPLGVYDFIKRTSLISAAKKGFMNLADSVETIADIEGLEAHANTIRVRKDSRQ